MTKRDYEAIAKIFAKHKPNEMCIGAFTTSINPAFKVWSGLIKDLSVIFKEDNPNFDYSKFREACEDEED